MNRQRSAEGARDILEDIREGRGADLDDIFAVTKPWLNDLSPVINLMRSKEEREQFARLAGDYTRKYDLNESQQKQLRQWLDARATENAERFVNVVANDSSTFYDLMLAGKEADLGEWRRTAATGEAAAGATEAVRTVLTSELAQPDLLPGGLPVATLPRGEAVEGVEAAAGKGGKKKGAKKGAKAAK